MLTWTDGAIADPAPATDAQVLAAEDALRVDLPSDFLVIARQHQGARPVPSGVRLPNGFGTAVQHLLHFEDAPFASNILAGGFPFEGVLPRGIILFAHDVGGELFCFNYRDNYDAPSVAFWSTDWGLVPLAPSFGAFLELLHDADEREASPKHMTAP